MQKTIIVMYINVTMHMSIYHERCSGQFKQNYSYHLPIYNCSENFVILCAMFVLYFTINHSTATSKSGVSVNLYMP